MIFADFGARVARAISRRGRQLTLSMSAGFPGRFFWRASQMSSSELSRSYRGALHNLCDPAGRLAKLAYNLAPGSDYWCESEASALPDSIAELEDDLQSIRQTVVYLLHAA